MDLYIEIKSLLYMLICFRNFYSNNINEMDVTNMGNNPKVFISYANDTEQLCYRARVFANSLKKKDIEVNIDQFVESPPEGWLSWMEKEIKYSDYVLIICNKAYLKKKDGHENNEGKGVSWELKIVYQYIYDSYSNNTKFIPIIFDGDSPDDIPIPLKDSTFYFPDDPESFNKLCSRLKGKRDENFVENVINEVKNVKKNDDNKIIVYEDKIKEYYDEQSGVYSVKSQYLEFYGFLPKIPNKLVGSCSIEFKRDELADIVITLNHTQILLLFEKIEMGINEYFFIEQHDKNGKFRFFLGNILLFLTKKEIIDFLKIMKKYYEYYMLELKNITAHFEIDKFQSSREYKLGYRLFEIKTDFWKLMKEFANKHDYLSGRSEWNIFNVNYDAINVISSINSQDSRYNSVMHAYFNVENTDSIGDDSVWLIINMNITRDYNIKLEDYNERNVWGALTAYKWLINEFLNRVAKEYNINNVEDYYNDFGIRYKLNLKKESIISGLQMFYMSNRVHITKTEIINLKQSLIFCLSKKELPMDEYEYILSKLGLIGKIQLKSNASNTVANQIVNILKTGVYQKHQSISSQVDDFFRCILLFVDKTNKNRLSDEEFEILRSKLNSLVEKMNNIEYIRKYLDFEHER